jgi:hypothetical protein
VTAFITGILGGGLTQLVAADPGAQPLAQSATRHERTLKAAFKYAWDDLLYAIWGWLVFGILVSALITTLIPPGFFAGLAALTCKPNV